MDALSGDSGDHGKWPGAVIFDLDGTLVDSLPDIVETLNQVLSEAGFETHSFGEIRQMVGGGVPKLLQRAFNAQGREFDDGLKKKLIPRFLELYSPRATQLTRLYPGAMDLIEWLSSNGSKIGLCTNKPTDISRKILQDLGVSQYFQSVVGGEPDLPKKPDPAPLLRVLDELQVKPAEAVMIGDSTADLGASQSAGTSFILVTYGYSRTPPEDLECVFRVDGLPQVEPLLKTFALSKQPSAQV